MIVGTAGHIDHGKTTLTRALTGVDTDRLKEEKERGISIELGYAYTPLPNGDVLGVIDVPGHEKLIHTMVAGASGIDYALLVVAADDGVMPQTREHLAILELLGVRKGAVAVTKADKVDAQRCEDVKNEIRRLLAATSLRDAAIFTTAAHGREDAGIIALRAHLENAAQEFFRSPEIRLFRLAIDRVFSLSGQGTIVAGTALSGIVTVGDVLTLEPSGLSARVRSIHAQNRPAETGCAGQRLALNLAGIAREQIARGDWLMAPQLAACSTRLDTELKLLAEACSPLKPWSPVHVHIGAAHKIAHLLPLQGDILPANQLVRAQLVFDVPMHAVPGERFIVRNAQATRTIGGGRVIDPFGATKKRRSIARHAWMDALTDFIDHTDHAALLKFSPTGMRGSMLTRLSQAPQNQWKLAPGIVSIPLRDDALLITEDALQRLGEQCLDLLADFHKNYPDEVGPQFARLKRMLDPDLDDSLWHLLLKRLSEAGLLTQTLSCLHLPAHVINLSKDEQILAEKLLTGLQQGGYNPPWVRDLATIHHLDETQVRQLLRKLARRGEAEQIVRDLFYHPHTIAELAQLLLRIATREIRSSTETSVKAVTVAGFRDASGLGRKRAVQLLEYFDRVGYTRRWRSPRNHRQAQGRQRPQDGYTDMLDVHQDVRLDVHLIRAEGPWK